MRSLSSKTMLAAAGLIMCAAGSLATAPAAEAQGRTTGRLELPRERGACPYGWNRETDTFCVPSIVVKPMPAVYVRDNKSIACDQGYFVDTINDLVCTSYDRMTARFADRPDGIVRAGRLNRCPTGWQASNNNKQCFTEIENAPIPRLKNGKPCAPGELDDWGIWCTSNYEHLSFAEVDLAGLRDFNTIYANAMNDGLDYNSIPDATLSPDAKAFFKGPDKSSGASPANPAAKGKDKNCEIETDTGAAVGGLIGGAVAGSEGAVIGSTLGGIGKKKKKKGC